MGSEADEGHSCKISEIVEIVPTLKKSLSKIQVISTVGG